MEYLSSEDIESFRNGPITRHIPNEILSDIFLLGYQSCPLHRPGSEPERFLSTITAVCGLWRDIAIAEASLWRSIRYSVPRISQISLTTNEISWDRISAYMTRSRNRALDFALWAVSPPRWSGRFLDGLDKKKNGVLELFFPYLQRCRTILIDLGGSRETTALVSQLFPLPGRMERLVDMRIILQMPNPVGDISVPPTSPPRSAVLFEPSNASPLVTLLLSSNAPHVVDMRNVESTVMEELEVGFGIIPSTPMLSALLEKNSNTLSSLSLADCPRFRGLQNGTQPQPPILLPYLKSLKLESYTLETITRDISCPKLEELTIHGVDSVRDRYDPRRFVPIFGYRVHFRPGQFAGWSSSLRTLRILTTLTSYYFQALLPELPMITSLAVVDRTIDQDSTAGLRVLVLLLTEQPTLVPNLAHLRVFAQAAPAPAELQPLGSSAAMIVDILGARPALRVECGKGCLMLSEEEVEDLKTANPHRFFEV